MSAFDFEATYIRCSKCGQRIHREAARYIADNDQGENARPVCAGGCFTFSDGSPVELDADGIICHEEAQEMVTSSLLGTLKDYVAPHAGSLIAGVIIGLAIGASFWFDHAELLWRN